MSKDQFDTPKPVFFTADWRWLVMLNYRVPASLLMPFVPRGTELDLWNGSPFVSVVGFMFERIRILGIPVLFHQSFEEVNLRFYVSRNSGGETRHGVTFVRELVPRSLVAAGARLSYNEPYRRLSIRHNLTFSPTGAPLSLEYRWNTPRASAALAAIATGNGAPPPTGSEDEFMTVRHWGYSRQRDGSTVEYSVKHPRWNVWRTSAATLSGAVAESFGAEFADILSKTPDSTLIADGSPVSLHAPFRLP
jgi:uncharacterized protein YqjF (DUF2071 family)